MECLMRNGDLSSCSSQQLYEVAWELGIRQVDEAALKPGQGSAQLKVAELASDRVGLEA
jgi:hypothetical protein